MPKRSLFSIVLTKREERELRRRETGKTLPRPEVPRTGTERCSEALRARMILMAAQDMESKVIAQTLGTSKDTVSKWRRRFFEQRLKGLEDSTGPPRTRSLLRQTPFSFVPTKSEERELRRRETGTNQPCSEVLRARMILMAAQGMQNLAIANALGTSRQTVSLWCKRFFEQRLTGLENQPKGRPQT